MWRVMGDANQHRDRPEIEWSIQTEIGSKGQPVADVTRAPVSCTMTRRRTRRRATTDVNRAEEQLRAVILRTVPEGHAG